VATALVALLLAACGGSDSGSQGTGSAGSEEGGGGSASSESGASGQGEGASGQGEAQQGGGSQPQRGERPLKSHSVKEVSVPLEVSGGGSEQFLVKEGDNSIQEFGEESDESELEAAARAVHDFYVARATGNWGDACSRTSASLREQLEQLAAKASTVKGCPAFLEAFTTALSAAAWREVTTVDAGSLRREGEQAFLIYSGAGQVAYAMPLKEEDGEWKVTSLSATTLGGA
jgi:hypothetical protein